MRGLFRAAVLAGAIVGIAAPATAATGPQVPSLEPAKTERLWRQLVQRGPLVAQQDCRALRAVFYAQSDWLRLATKLAATPSPCAHYYVAVPAPTANRTQPRTDQAHRIRALGPNFHAVAEIHYTGWTRWVAENQRTWYEAGVTARERMAAAGYDVTRGDTWAINEASTAVRRGTGAARANLLEFLRGLYEGTGVRAKGILFVIGIGQTLGDPSLYQSNLQNWYADTPFWERVAEYVSDWSQEVYADARRSSCAATT